MKIDVEIILNILIGTPCFVILIILLLNLLEIVDVFHSGFFELMMHFDPSTQLYRRCFAIVLFLLIVMVIIGIQQFNSREVYFMCMLAFISCTIIVGSWISEWFIVRNLDSSVHVMKQTVKNFTSARVNNLNITEFNYNNSYANIIMRYFGCCGYDSKENKLYYKLFMPCIDFIESTARLPPPCQETIGIGIENHLMSSMGLMADFRIMCILLLIGILIAGFISFEDN